MDGGGQMAVRGKKGAFRALGLAMRSADSTNTKIVGTAQQQQTGVVTIYGSSTGHLSVGGDLAQNNPLMIRVFTNGTGDPSTWSNAGEVAQFAAQAPTTAFCWTWKGNKAVITGSPTGLAYTNMRNKWINIFVNQVPDVAKDGGVLDHVGWWHEPFKSPTNDVDGAPWAQAHINLHEWVQTANQSRTHKLGVVGVYNGHPTAMQHVNEFFPPELLALTNPVVKFGTDCYNWVDHPNQQVTLGHNFSVSKSNHPWMIPEFGWSIHTDSRRPTDAASKTMAQTLVADVASYTPASRPYAVLWFNNGSGPFDGIDTANPNSTNPPSIAGDKYPNVALPTTLAYWSGLNG